MNEKLQEIRLENFVLIIYFILLILYYYANTIEVEYIKYHQPKNKDKYRLILYIIFGTTFLIALYYTIANIKDLNNITNEEIYKLRKLSTIAGILILIATSIYLYIIYKDKNIDLEVTL